MKGATLIGANYERSRKAMDYYPTPANVTVALIKFLNISDKTIWEPACGGGHMSIVLAERNMVYSSDIRTGGVYGKGGIDFLKAGIESSTDFDAIITNPPFNLADQFILKACSLSPLVCMLLKSQYWHAKTRTELFQNNPPAWVLPLTWRPDFLEHERKAGERGSSMMDMIWTVWIEGDTDTKYRLLSKPTK